MTQRTKNTVLVVGFLLTLLLSYKLAISKTQALKVTYSSLKQEALRYKNAPRQLSLLKQKQRYYDSLLGIHQIKGKSIQNNLLKTINTFAASHGVKVVSFEDPHKFNNDGFTAVTYRFTAEGNYNALINLIYLLEQKTKFGTVLNLHFEKKKNFKANTHYLQVRVLLAGAV